MQKQLLGYPSKAGPVSRQLWQIWDRLNMLGGLVRHGDARIHCVILQHTLKVKGDNNTSTSAFVRLLAGLTTPPKALVSPITSSKEAKIYAVDRKAARQGTPFPVASASLLSKCARKMPAK